MKSSAELRTLLSRIDHKSYPAYKDTRGVYQFEGYVLSIDHVQGDPFASPSKVSIHVKGGQAGIPGELFDKRHKRVAIQDYLTRQFGDQVRNLSFKSRGTGKSGLLSVSHCGQEILERSACQIDEQTGDIILRMEVGFPAHGRTIAAGELIRMLFDYMPDCVKKSLFYRFLDSGQVRRTAELAEDQEYLRQQLPAMGLTAFVANGAVLPRESGISQRPMKGAVKFQSPESMAVTMELPHHGTIKGMGIKTGITLIVGGGYHGKSTLLKALEVGVYNHIAGDGREYVMTDHTAMKIRAEDGRSIKGVDISLFINGLPNGKETRSFYTEDASGSTSQAANVVEAMETGTGLFLIDEDTSATNFMIRDELMQKVVHRDSEPITPFIDRVSEIDRQLGISTVLVVGSSGSYFHKADWIIQMDRYRPKEITEYAKHEAMNYPAPEADIPAGKMPSFVRHPQVNRAVRDNDRVKVKHMGTDSVSVNRDNVDMRQVEQLVDSEQLAALGYILTYAEKNLFDGKRSLRAVVDEVWELVETRGLAAVCGGSYLPSNLALPRKQEIFACLNRYRGLNL